MLPAQVIAWQYFERSGRITLIMADKKRPVPPTDNYGPRQLKSLARRRQVLAAANRCFSRNGFAKTSIQLVASEAGVSKALVFAFFGHKDALYDAVIEQTLITWTGFAEHEAARFHDRPELELAEHVSRVF